MMMRRKRRKRRRMRIDWLSVPVCQWKVLAANLVSNKSGNIKTLDAGKTPTHPPMYKQTSMCLRVSNKAGHNQHIKYGAASPFGGMGVTDALACV